MLPGMRSDGETARIGATLRPRARAALQGFLRVLEAAALEVDPAADASPGPSPWTDAARPVGVGRHPPGQMGNVQEDQGE